MPMIGMQTGYSDPRFEKAAPYRPEKMEESYQQYTETNSDAEVFGCIIGASLGLIIIIGFIFMCLKERKKKNGNRSDYSI